MRLGGGNRRAKIEEQRERLRREGWEPEPDEALTLPAGTRLHDVRCGKCGSKIGEVERTGPEDVIVLPPDQEDYTGPLPHPWTVVLWCRRCRERRRLIQHPEGPAAENGTGKKTP